MREIKFRAWDKKLKEMVFTGFHVIGEVTCFNLISDYCFKTKRKDKPSMERWNDILLMQYTGLKDKNGKEIYEGDILVYEEENYPSLNTIVEWGDGSFIIKWLHSKAESPIFSYPAIQLEVIGNIYENPELLK